MHIQEIEIISFVNPTTNKRVIKEVKAKLDILKETANALEFYDAHSPNAMYSLQMGAKGMSSISGNFYPEILVWMVNNANDPAKQEEVKWLQAVFLAEIASR